MTTMVADLSSVLHACRWGSGKEAGFSIPLIIHSTIDSILNNALLFKCDKVFVACDGKDYWRREIFPTYKAGRPKDEHYEEMKEIFMAVKEFFGEYTKIPVCEVHRAEADDIIARAVEIIDDDIVILSTDKDFVQLISDRVRLYSPTKNTGERFSEDPEFDLFVKCIRGDSSDAIKSAYPRVRLKKLEEAYNCPSKMVELMEHTNKDGTLVKDRFAENKELIDLSMIPDDMKSIIDEHIMEKLETPVKVSMFKPLRFYGKYELKNLEDQFNIHRKLLV